MNNSTKIKRMVGISILMALVVVLQLIANYITINGISITLALTPIVLGAILYGPTAGFILGFVMGILVIASPSTIGVFMPINTFGTILVCLLKTSLAGLVAGYVFKLTRKFNLFIAIVLTALVVPILNTTLFAVGALIFFRDLLQAEGQNMFEVLLFGMIGINFLIELSVNAVLSPSLAYITKIVVSNNNLGTNLE